MNLGSLISSSLAFVSDTASSAGVKVGVCSHGLYSLMFGLSSNIPVEAAKGTGKGTGTGKASRDLTRTLGVGVTLGVAVALGVGVVAGVVGVIIGIG